MDAGGGQGVTGVHEDEAIVCPEGRNPRERGDVSDFIGDFCQAPAPRHGMVGCDVGFTAPEAVCKLQDVDHAADSRRAPTDALLVVPTGSAENAQLVV